MDRPIIFSAPMVRALLEGRKQQTRRLAMQTRKTHPSNASHDTYELPSPWQKVKPGDRLWVRETCKAEERADSCDGVRYVADQTWIIIENSQAAADRWVDLNHYRKQRGAVVPPIHMPRWTSRLTLTVTAVKVERLIDISEEDAIAEGVEAISIDDVPRQASWSNRQDFSRLWEKLHGTGAWDANPEVVAITFRVEKRNIDALAPT